MAKKDIRITFFYADEGIWDDVKKHKIKDRVVKWADDFYHHNKYGYRIDHTPIPYNERLYRKKFCLSRTDGLVRHTVDLSRLDDEVWKKIRVKENIRKIRNALGPIDSLNPAGIALWKSYNDAMDNLDNEILQLKLKYNDRFEKEVRRLFYPIILSLNTSKERLPVLFCQFDHGPNGPGITMMRSGFFWSVPAMVNHYTGVFAMIGVNNVMSTSDNVLAHEIGHAAGCHHQDTPANNLMLRGRDMDNSRRNPSDMMMTPEDLTRLSVAPFVI